MSMVSELEGSPESNEWLVRLRNSLNASSPLYTRALLEKWYNCSLMIFSDKGGSAVIPAYRADGSEDHITITWEKDECVQIYLPSYHQWLNPGGYVPPGGDARFRDSLFKIHGWKITPQLKDPTKCCEFFGAADHFENMRMLWKNSPFCQKLVHHIKTNGTLMETVNHIQCFALGALKESDEQYDHINRTFLQHAAAMEIRDALQEVQPFRVPGCVQYGQESDPQLPRLPQLPAEEVDHKIRIYAQDPAYCSKCLEILSDRYGIISLATPAGFYYLNQNTFVISIAPDVAVRQIVADVTAEGGGPAGMLCDRIGDDGLHYANPVQEVDPSSPRLLKYRTENKELELKLDDSDDTVEFRGYNLPFRVFETVGLYLKMKKA